MAALALKYSETPREESRSISSLRGWLQGRWALLFSHPNDFASYGFEADRWLVHVADGLSAANIAPIELASPENTPPATWISEVGGCTLRIRWSDARRLAGVAGRRERTLVSTVVGATSRFVLILDDSFRPRRTFAYSAAGQLPSPIDLTWMAHRLRAETMPPMK
jgi:hypothetical protein